MPKMWEREWIDRCVRGRDYCFEVVLPIHLSRSTMLDAANHGSFFIVTWRQMHTLVTAKHHHVSSGDHVQELAMDMLRAKAVATIGGARGMNTPVAFFFDSDEEACAVRLRYF